MNIIVCDAGCGRKDIADLPNHFYHLDSPDEKADFCSLECLAKWAQGMSQMRMEEAL